MTTSAQNTSPQPIQRPGLIISAIILVLRIIGVLMASLVFSILIEFAGLLLVWGDQGLAAQPGHVDERTGLAE
ncbi:putative membrane protein [Pseudomonas sp. W3I7]|nr:putative membrane protein [Pseudomonas sp. W3I7]